MKKLLLLTVIFVVACGADVPTDNDKPGVDPDVQFDDRADRLSNRYTTIVGQVDLFDTVESSIDYPDYFHGYLVTLEEGTELKVELETNAQSLFRLYGPMRNNDFNNPRFGRAQVRAGTQFEIHANRHVGSIRHTAEAAGTYMIVLGPKFVWEAKYSLDVSVVRDGECSNDSECADTETCVDNGVRCVRAPCHANYDICIPAETGCSTSDDCGADAWCRSTDWGSNVRECVPFVGEGESCSGFAPPQYINSCSPEFQCVFRPFVADAPGTCRNNITVQELLADPVKWEGSRVNVDGYLDLGPMYCTKMACSQENPCCNSCGASMKFSDKKGELVTAITLVDVDQNEFSCGGNECTTADNCTAEIGETRVVGVVRIDQFGLVSIEVENHQPLSFPNF